MGSMSRQKGKRGEREAAAAIQAALKIDARRGQQFSGSEESPDVVTSLDKIHIEVKRTESLRMWDALSQAESDSGSKLPVVLHRKNKKRWVAICYLDDLLEVSSEIYSKCVLTEINTENKAQ